MHGLKPHHISYLSYVSLLGVLSQEFRWTFAFLAFLPFGLLKPTEDVQT